MARHHGLPTRFAPWFWAVTHYGAVCRQTGRLHIETITRRASKTWEKVRDLSIAPDSVRVKRLTITLYQDHIDPKA